MSAYRHLTLALAAVGFLAAPLGAAALDCPFCLPLVGEQIAAFRVIDKNAVPEPATPAVEAPPAPAAPTERAPTSGVGDSTEVLPNVRGSNTPAPGAKEDYGYLRAEIANLRQELEEVRAELSKLKKSGATPALAAIAPSPASETSDLPASGSVDGVVWRTDAKPKLTKSVIPFRNDSTFDPSQQIADGLTRHARHARRIVITGFASGVQNTANDTLAKRRAEKVRSFLIAQGIDASKLVVRTDTRKIANESTSSGRLANRRVEVLFLRE